MALYHVYSQTVADGTATSVVRPSDWNSAHSHVVTLGGNTLGASALSGTNIIFQGGSNVTLSGVQGAGVATMVISAAGGGGGGGAVAFSASGGSSSFTTLSFSNQANDVTFSNSAGQVALSHSLQPLSNTSAITSNAFPSANTTKFAGTGTTFAGANLSGSMTLNSNGLNLSMSAAAGGGGADGYNILAAGTQTANTTGTVVFQNGGGVTFGMSNSSQITATVATNYMASNQSSNFAGVGYTSTTQAGTTVGATHNTAGLSMAWPPFITTYVAQTTQTQATGNIAGTGYTSTTQAGTTVGLTHNTAGLSVAWPPYITTYVAQTTQTQATGNIAGTGYTSTTQAGTTVGVTHNTAGLSMAWPPYITTFAAQTVQPVAFSASGGSSNFSTLSFSNLANGVTFSNSAGQVAMSHSLQQLSNTSAITSNAFPSTDTTKFAGTGTTFAGTNISASVTLNSVGLNLALSGGGGGTVNQTGPNIAVAGSTVTSGDVLFSNANLLTFGMAGSTITASYGNPSNWKLFGNTAGTTSSTNGTDGIYFSGGNGVTLSGNSNTIVVSAAGGGGGATVSFMEPNMLVGTSLSSFGQNSLYFLPVKPLQNVTMTKINMLVSLNNATSSISHAKSQTISYGLYSLGTGTNNTRIESMATSSMVLIASYSSNLSGGYTLSQGTNSTTYSSAGTGSTSAWTGQRIFAMPFATSISEGGEYYFCIANSTASVGAVSALMLSHIVLNNMTNGSWGNMGVNGITVSNLSVIPNYAGFIYSATSGAWPSTIALSQRSIYSNVRPYIQLDA